MNTAVGMALMISCCFVAGCKGHIENKEGASQEASVSQATRGPSTLPAGVTAGSTSTGNAAVNCDETPDLALIYGTEETNRVLAMMANPAADAETLGRMRAVFDLCKAVDLSFQAPDLVQVHLIRLYATRPGEWAGSRSPMQIESIVYQAPPGEPAEACRGLDVMTLSERYDRCWDNRRITHYSVSSISGEVASLEAGLISAAQNLRRAGLPTQRRYLESAIHYFNLNQLGGEVFSMFQAENLQYVLLASGYHVDLGAPVLWAGPSNANADAVKAVAAMVALEGAGMGFLRPGMVCSSEATSTTDSPAGPSGALVPTGPSGPSGPLLLPRSEMQSLIVHGRCTHAFSRFIVGELFEAMTQAGYLYDAATGHWGRL